ncbi:hypothetical protein [Helicobacter sp. CLO-3]|uniref:hypothetical protein n=2 Tax=Helicobacter TaxID=209 RepID=UPI00115FD58B|nr:hypothetical protein [Helicobacter sp. CLO-3]
MPKTPSAPKMQISPSQPCAPKATNAPATLNAFAMPRARIRLTTPSRLAAPIVPATPATRGGFIMLEIVFALLIIGVVFGVFAHFYNTRQQIPALSISELDLSQEQALKELESSVSPTPHKIIGTNGEFCERELFETTQAQSKYKLFIPQNCDK